MSPSPSQVSAPVDPVRKGGHSRHNSTAGQVSGDTIRVNRQQASAAAPTASRPVHYTCIIRLPFDRNGFEDPPPLQWDTIKDRALWKLISHTSNSKDLNWEEMSIHFNVSLAFLLQQAAWLYERHFEGMKAQMKKLGNASMATGGTSPLNQTEGGLGSAVGVGGVSMQRTGSKGSRAPMMPLALQTTRETVLGASGGDAGSSPATPRNSAPPISRTASTGTVTQSKIQAGGHPRSQPLQRALRGSSGSDRRPNMPVVSRVTNDAHHENAVEHEGPFASDSEEETSALARSRALRRAPLAKKPKPSMSRIASDGDAEAEDGDSDSDSDGDDEDSGSYLPFATASTRPPKPDPAATLKTSLRKPGTTPHDAAGPASRRFKTKAPPPSAAPPPPRPESPTSSASSAMQQQLSSSGTEGFGELVQRPGPLSPRHRAQLASLSPRGRREGAGSEDSPSMGSSFSDLDDVGGGSSVSQSALEEALMSNIRRGNFGSMASRMSSLRDALGR